MPGEHRISHLGPKNLSGQPGGPEHYLLNGRTKQIPYKWVKQITMLVHLFFKETDHNVGALVFWKKKEGKKKLKERDPRFSYLVTMTWKRRTMKSHELIVE